MAKKIVQINFKYNVSEDELLKLYDSRLDYFVKLEGLDWKIWIHDPATKTAGAIYLFKDEKSFKDYETSYIEPRLKKNPALSDVEVKVFDIMTKYTKATRGPV